MLRRHFLSASAALLTADLLPAGVSAQPPAPKQRVAVLGHTGRGNYGHGIDILWLHLEQTQVVAVADPDPQGLSAAQKRLPGAQPFAKYRRMLEETRPDIAAICPRHADQHHAMISAAIQAGVRGIYIEKPFVRTPAEADEVVRLCKEHGVSLAIAHRNRFHPALPVLADLLDSGALGVPLEIRARGKEDQRGGGLDLWVLGSHVLNLGVFFGGKPLSCSAAASVAGRPAGPADVHEGDEGLGPIVGEEVHARFEMERGLPLFFDSKKNAGDRAAPFGLQIICSGGIADLRMDTEPLVQILKGNPFKPVSEPRAWVPLTSAGLGKPEPLTNIRALIAGHQQPALDLLSALQTGAPLLCGPEDGRTVVEMIHSVFTSHLKNGAKVSLPLPNRGHALAL
ncbi:MAG: putative dehydrogenase [Verrucomicrobia bacterium]|nr:MAG: putative dehydrogenase [Verrucomicrobiota bacterium]